MIGTPDEVIERIKHYQELGVDEFAYWIDNGMTHAQKKESLELFVQQVVPAFQEQPAAAAR
jgi:alkanesulfonate monooxygenase SsuD/methylene tetrahydromethanopterin reductase-like flavin-dependent oxidoreductase (luciferase family)